MTKSRGSNKNKNEYLNDDFESVCSEDSINYFLNPSEPKNKKYNRKEFRKHQKNDEGSKSMKMNKDFEIIKKKIQNKSDRLKLFYGDDMYSNDGIDSDVLKEVISDRQSDDDSIDDSEILSSIINDEYIDEQKHNDELDDSFAIKVIEECVSTTNNDENDTIISLTDEDCDYELDEIIKWKNSEDLVLENEEEERNARDLANLEDNESDNTFLANTCQRIGEEEMPMSESKTEELNLDIDNDLGGNDGETYVQYVIEEDKEIIPRCEQGWYEIVHSEGEFDDEKYKKDEKEKERNSDDKGEEEFSYKEEIEEKGEIEDNDDTNCNEIQNRIQFLSETIAKLKAELNEAKEAVEEEKKATKIPGHACNMLEPCTVAAQLEERLRLRREAAAAAYREELQQVERMVSQEIARLEEDMSKLKPLNKLAADWEIPRDPQLRSIMYRHDYMLVASDITLNIPNELKSFFSTELKDKNLPALQ